MTTVFGLLLPTYNMSRAQTTFYGLTFTVASGFLIAASLLLLSRYASRKVAGFFVSFLAVQCVLNALFDLKTLFFLSSPFSEQVHSDAMNMAQATGFPPMVWVLIWISLSVFLLSVALRVYAVSRQKDAIQPDLPFED
ncbi:MAG: M50 family metallopeptidase [Pyrinomonadaceae bacterium]|nr:M50 family metallopeptidase [Pyrinomonadaceae bacterium]